MKHFTGIVAFSIYKYMLDTEIVEQPVEVAAEVVEGAAEPEVVVGPDTPEVVEPVVDEPNPDEDKGDEPDGDEPKTDEPEVVVEPVTFDAESPEFLTQANEVIEKYDLTELPEDLQALIPALIAKANAPVDGLAEFAAYAPEGASSEVIAEAVKTRIDRQALLEGVERVGDSEFRPTTDKFVATLDPKTGSWLYFDLAKQPSTEYPGITQFEESIVNAFGKEGEPIGIVLARYKQFTEAMATGIIQSDVPEFIPQQVHEAFYKLSKEARNELSLLDPSEDYDVAQINQKLNELALIQKGIDGDRAEQARTQQTKQQQAEAFVSTVQAKQSVVWNNLREQFAKDLLTEVVFSTEPKMQALLANQNVTLVTQCFEQGATGDFARKSLADAGITFDAAKAQSLLDDVEAAAVALTKAEQTVDDKGQQLDQIALNKASAQFRQAVVNCQNTAKDIRDQLARLTSTGKAEEVKTEVAKQKVALKARPATKGAPSAATSTPAEPPATVPYGSPEWDKWWATQTRLEQEAKKAARYQTA